MRRRSQRSSAVLLLATLVAAGCGAGLGARPGGDEMTARQLPVPTLAEPAATGFATPEASASAAPTATAARASSAAGASSAPGATGGSAGSGGPVGSSGSGASVATDPVIAQLLSQLDAALGAQDKALQDDVTSQSQSEDQP